jgi:tRNA A-37 threonylcarbamoyl transferase component Bud32/tetratricopeptide (TPR) repeat protein
MFQPPQPHNAADPTPLAPPLDPIGALRTALRGHYDIEREIGQGAFATVYLAQDLKHERKVALKVLLADPTSDTGELRFIREIRVLARLQHPNILPLHDSGHVDALLYYVMPYVAGETLRDRINRERQLEVSAAFRIAREAADALAYAHGQGIIHRDIKPENILLSAGHPMLADFGIARAIDLAGVRQLTRTGTGSPGTPAYMSPEQLMGDRELDGRSDIYSLGCVLYEMLTGKPPFTGKEGFVKRFTETAPSVSSVRRDVPPWVDRVVGTALERAQNDRYQTAYEFATELARRSGVREKFAPYTNETPAAAPPPAPADVERVAALNPREAKRAAREAARAAKALLARSVVAGMAPAATPDEHRSWSTRINKRRALIAAIGTVLVLAAAATARDRIPGLRGAFFGSELDSTKIALVPFGGSGSRADRDRILNRLYGALTEWRGLKIASDQDAGDVTSSSPPRSIRDAANLARSVGAATFIWGQLNADDPSHVRVELFDVSSNVPRKSFSLPANADSSALRGTVRQLLKMPNRPPGADGGDGRTTSYTAWSAYARGHLGIQTGEFVSAEKNFQEAVTADPDFAPARIWLAQVRAWLRPSSRQEWRDDVIQGIHAGSGLSQKDSLIGASLSSLADKRYPDACLSYSRMVARDSLDFVGLYGLGQCRALDSLVVPSASSPSKWEFRSRYSEAAAAFMKAVSINPAAHGILSFEQMQELQPIGSTKTRRGMNAAGEEFAAYPTLIRNTVIFVPYPVTEFARLPARQTASQQAAALSRDLDVLLDFTTAWTRDAPQSAQAYQALGDVLEARGEITHGRSIDMSAVQAIDRARELASNSHDRFVSSTSAAWLLFKQGQFAQARSLADSILSAQRGGPSDEAATIIGLAALTGKLAKTTELARVTIPYAASAAKLPVAVMDAAAPFFAFAALGVCSDTTARLERRLDEQIAHYVAEDEQSQVTASVKTRPLSMLASCTNASASLRIPSGSSRIVKMQQALARGDSAATRSMLNDLTTDSRTQRPGDISLDFAYQAAWLRAATGDTLGAARQLDRMLGAIPSIGAASLREPASAAAAGRAMALRAELAAAKGELDVRQKWGRALADLWSTADAPLQPTVHRMRSLAAGTVSR